MSDKELLEKAAKAYGLFNHKYCEAWKAIAAYDSVEDSYYGESWNPLTDDGDALRLAAKLGLFVYQLQDIGKVAIRVPSEHMGGKFDEVEDYGSDPFAATRLAITRAAVTIYENS